MLRALLLSIVALLSVAAPALAGPELDDVATCRERQNDAKARLDACERVIAAGQARPRIWRSPMPCAARRLLDKREL